MGEDRWLECDLPILEALAKLEDGADRHFGVPDLAGETGFDAASVKRSLRRLEGEYLTFTALSGNDEPLSSARNIRLLGSGRRATKQWPTPESALSLLVDGAHCGRRASRGPSAEVEAAKGCNRRCRASRRDR